jgi:anti-anti-sigma regulatory factor
LSSADEQAPGVVTTQVTDTGLLVQLAGEVDLCLRPELEALAGHLAGYEGAATVDLTQLTFGDATLAAFLAEGLGSAQVTVNAPTRLARELIALYGLGCDVRVSD